MDKEKKEKKEVLDNQEDFILKKIRYYQGTIDDYETFWNKKSAEGEKEECPETKSFAKRNAELNKAFEIVPVEKDETVICKDVVSGKDVDEKPAENPDAQPSEKEEGNQDAKKDAGVEADKEGEKVDDKKKEKKEEKHEEEEEVKEKDEKKEEKGEDDEDDDKKKKSKKDKED